MGASTDLDEYVPPEGLLFGIRLVSAEECRKQGLFLQDHAGSGASLDFASNTPDWSVV